MDRVRVEAAMKVGQTDPLPRLEARPDAFRVFPSLLNRDLPSCTAPTFAPYEQSCSR